MLERMNCIYRLGLVITLLSLVPGCHSGGSLPGLDDYAPGPDIPPLDAVEAKVIRLMDAMDTASASSPGRFDGTRCRAAVPAHARSLPATPTECTVHEAQLETRDALRTVQHALVRDLFPLVAQLQHLSRARRLGEDQWLVMVGSTLGPTVSHVEWIVDALRTSHGLTENADLERPDQWMWQKAGRQYESALLGAQVLSVWVSWLDFGKQLHARTTLDPEWIMVHLLDAWEDMEPVLESLRPDAPHLLEDKVTTLQSKLPEWTGALADWGTEANTRARESAELTEKLLIVQTAFEMLAMGKAAGSIGRARAFAFIMPGIGGVTAGGVATGVRVVVSAEWVAALKHLIAIGAISTAEIAKLAGISVARLEPGRALTRGAKGDQGCRGRGQALARELAQAAGAGRWVERKARDRFRNVLTWSSKGVDFVDPRTGIQYEVLSGTRNNLDLHAKRMANELFRMITF